MNSTILRFKRLLKKPPHVIISRVLQELRSKIDPIICPIASNLLTQSRLLNNLNQPDLDSLWQSLSHRTYPAQTNNESLLFLKEIEPSVFQAILNNAELAINHKVDLLGTGLISLGEVIDWHKDYKTNKRWQPRFCKKIEYNNLDQPSDVKIPWEISRLQWLIPAGQAYLITPDEKYAIAVKNILLDWIENNPYAYSVNWSCTMEVALRILSWSWFFHIFKNTKAWSDHSFKFKFLKSLFQHAEFTVHYLEKSDINGNHYIANAAGLVFAGLFFPETKYSKRWQKIGWNILCQEINVQVYPDGVDYEGSIAYHRLVLELFLFPALYRQSQGLPIPFHYKEKLIKMAKFIAAYTRPDGSVPLWGDSDDGRALPFSFGNINDHRYLLGLMGIAFSNKKLISDFTGSLAEINGWFGKNHCKKILSYSPIDENKNSIAFKNAGYYIMRNKKNHIFIDCGPIGLAGHGGHGHNDCLSFSAMLDGELLIVDCGSYVYTASYKDRNKFRSTSSHNTPQIDNKEINPFFNEKDLWNLNYQAIPKVINWEKNNDSTLFIGTHTGFQTINPNLKHKRVIKLINDPNELTIEDIFTGGDRHQIRIPLHLDDNVLVEKLNDNSFIFKSHNKVFKLTWVANVDFSVSIDKYFISPSYGKQNESKRIVWNCHHRLKSSFKMILQSA